MSSRESICAWFKATCDAMVVDTPTGNTTTFREVTRDPIGPSHIAKLAVGEMLGGVYGTDESVKHVSVGENRTFDVILEVYLIPKMGSAKATQLNKIIADLQLAFRKTQCGGLALSVKETHNSIDIDGIYDKVINCSITFEVTYRVSYC